MPIRPVDFQNVLARINTMAKQMSHKTEIQETAQQLNDKKLQKDYHQDKKVTKSEKTQKEDANALKILYDKNNSSHHSQHTYNKKKKKFYSDDDEEHIIDEKI